MTVDNFLFHSDKFSEITEDWRLEELIKTARGKDNDIWPVKKKGHPSPHINVMHAANILLLGGMNVHRRNIKKYLDARHFLISSSGSWFLNDLAEYLKYWYNFIPASSKNRGYYEQKINELKQKRHKASDDELYKINTELKKLEAELDYIGDSKELKGILEIAISLDRTYAEIRYIKQGQNFSIDLNRDQPNNQLVLIDRYGSTPANIIDKSVERFRVFKSDFLREYAGAIRYGAPDATSQPKEYKAFVKMIESYKPVNEI